MNGSVPDDNNTNLHLFILDPLSVIIKLAIISNKPVGTKIRINNNIIYLQEPGPFQAICRYVFKSNKSDIHYLYNPIEIACKHYLSDADVASKNPKIKELFIRAQHGLLKLIDTYKSCSLICVCLNFYYGLISNHLEGNKNNTLFRKDMMSLFYTDEVLLKMYQIWSHEKIKVILNLITFLNNDDSAEVNVKSLETIMDGIDSGVMTLMS